jgi:hypothetical protein
MNCSPAISVRTIMSTALARPLASCAFPCESPKEPLPADDLALLDAVGPVAGAHVLVIGDATLGLLCGLIRRGCLSAGEMHGHDRACAEPAELVLVPNLQDGEAAARAVAVARRVVQPGGSIVLRDVAGGLARSVASLLTGAGFSAIRVRPWPRGALISAERPSFGPFARG